MTLLDSFPATPGVHARTRTECVSAQPCLRRGWGDAPSGPRGTPHAITNTCSFTVQTAVVCKPPHRPAGAQSTHEDRTHRAHDGLVAMALTGAPERSVGGRARGQRAGSREETRSHDPPEVRVKNTGNCQGGRS